MHLHLVRTIVLNINLQYDGEDKLSDEAFEESNKICATLAQRYKGIVTINLNPDSYVELLSKLEEIFPHVRKFIFKFMFNLRFNYVVNFYFIIDWRV